MVAERLQLLLLATLLLATASAKPYMSSKDLAGEHLLPWNSTKTTVHRAVRAASEGSGDTVIRPLNLPQMERLEAEETHDKGSREDVEPPVQGEAIENIETEGSGDDGARAVGVVDDWEGLTKMYESEAGRTESAKDEGDGNSQNNSLLGHGEKEGSGAEPEAALESEYGNEIDTDDDMKGEVDAAPEPDSMSSIEQVQEFTTESADIPSSHPVTAAGEAVAISASSSPETDSTLHATESHTEPLVPDLAAPESTAAPSTPSVPFFQQELQTTPDYEVEEAAESNPNALETNTDLPDVTSTDDSVPDADSDVTTAVSLSSTDEESITDVPETSSDVLGTITDGSDTITAVPEISTDVPSTDVSETSPEVPEPITDISETSTDVPETSTDVSETSTDVPETSTDVSETSTDVPETSTDVSETSTDVEEMTTETGVAETVIASDTRTPELTTEVIEPVSEVSSSAEPELMPIEPLGPYLIPKNTKSLESVQPSDEEVVLGSAEPKRIGAYIVVGLILLSFLSLIGYIAMKKRISTRRKAIEVNLQDVKDTEKALLSLSEYKDHPETEENNVKNNEITPIVIKSNKFEKNTNFSSPKNLNTIANEKNVEKDNVLKSTSDTLTHVIIEEPCKEPKVEEEDKSVQNLEKLIVRTHLDQDSIPKRAVIVNRSSDIVTKDTPT